MDNVLDAWGNAVLTQPPVKQEEIKQEAVTNVEQQEEVKTDVVNQEAPQIDIETEALKFLSQKTNKEFNSWDEVKFDEPKQDDTSELAKTIDKWVKETGRGINEWLYVQSVEQNLDKASAADVIKEQMKLSNPDLTNDDVDALFEDRYTLKPIDEDTMDDAEIAAAKKHNRVVELKMKQEADKAKEYIKEQIEKFRVPEQKQPVAQDEPEFDEKDFLSRLNGELDGTDEIEFDLGDNVNFKFVIDEEVKKEVRNVTPQSYIASLMDENGNFDVETFMMHQLVINNAEKLVAYASSQKAASKVEEVVKEMKNVNLESNKKDANFTQKSSDPFAGFV